MVHGSCLLDIIDRGFFLAASYCGIPFVSDASTAEAQALRGGLIMAGQVGCNRLEVNLDCIEVIEVMQNGGNSFGPAAAIYEECTSLCHNFIEVQFFHYPREANMTADSLARYSEGPTSIVWHEEPPEFLVSIFSNDVTIFAEIIKSAMMAFPKKTVYRRRLR
jgi:hypothetical protein